MDEGHAPKYPTTPREIQGALNSGSASAIIGRMKPLFALFFSVGATALLTAGCAGEASAPAAWDELPGDAGVRMYAYVEDFISISPRDSGTVGAARASRWIAEEIKRMGLRPEADCWTETTPFGRRTFCNVWVDIPGRSGQTVILGSHYDTKVGIPGFQGANDGGSSVGVLLGLLEHFVENDVRPRDTIRFAFFDGEEAQGTYGETDGLHGSRRMAKAFYDRVQGGERTPLLACIIVDMVGDRDLRLEIPRNVTPWLARAARVAVKDHPSGVRFALNESPALIDDHLPFTLYGFSAIDFIDFDFGSAPGLHDYWHTPEDTIDKLSPRSLYQTGSLLLSLVSCIERDVEVPSKLRKNAPK